MKRSILPLTLLLIFGTVLNNNTTTCHAQPPGQDNIHTKVIDTALLECTYDLRYSTDTLAENGKMSDDVLILEIGKKTTKFYSYKSLVADSMLKGVISLGMIIENVEKFRGGETYCIYRYLEKNEIVFTDQVARDAFRYEEKAGAQQWEISDGEKEILGYRCQMATCDFRGRRYTAWFAPEIPVDAGPWKFNGLPGLILAVEDDAGHYSFEATGIRKLEDRPITYIEKQYHRTNRKDFLRAIHRFKTDPAGYMMTDTSINMKFLSPDGTFTDEKPAPVELTYDFLERDYR